MREVGGGNRIGLLRWSGLCRIALGRVGTAGESYVIIKELLCKVALFFVVKLAEVYTLNTFIRFQKTAETHSFMPSLLSRWDERRVKKSHFSV